MFTGWKKATLGWVGLFLVLAGTPVVFISCYPGEELTVSDLDVVATFFDPAANFATKQTYYMPNFIFDLTDSSMQNDANAQSVLDEINEHMMEIGYTVADTGMADVRLIAFKTKSTWISGGCYPTYYPYYYGWCYPVAYSYQTGTFVLVMQENNGSLLNANALWVAGMNGVLEGSTTASLTSRLHAGIEQAFEQSPYLGEGK